MYQQSQKFYLEWNKPCLYGCGFIHLATAAGEEQKCCMGGRTSYDPEVFPYPALRPMTTTMAGIFRDSKRFSQHSSTRRLHFKDRPVCEYCNE